MARRYPITALRRSIYKLGRDRTKMSSEPNRSLQVLPERWGANGVSRSGFVVVCNSSSQLGSESCAICRGTTVAPSVQVPSLGAQLCSSSCWSAFSASRSAGFRRVVVRLVRSGWSWDRCSRIARWPNKSLEPTPVGNSPSLRVGSGAAQLSR